MHVNTTGLKIRKLRELRNYTQEYMAERLKIGQNTYSRYERGEIEPKVSHLRTIAEVLDVPIEEILRPDPIVVNISQTENANGVVHQQNNVPTELFEKLVERYDARVMEMERTNQRLMDLLEKLMKNVK